MSDLTNLWHAVSGALVSDFNALKAAITSSPQVQSAVENEVTTLENTVNSTVSAAGAALAAEANAIPYFGPAISAAIAAGTPTVIADLQAAEAKAAAFIDGLVPAA